jgi:hypothetical protein
MLLALLALAAPAYAISDDAYNQLTTTAGPAAISVSTSLDSCGVMDDGIVCKLDVSFNSVPNADTYSATVTRADGSVIDYGSVSPGGTSLWVPYVGAGNYSVKITAYGEPETPEEEKDGHGDVIATGVSRAPDRGDDNADGDERDAHELNVEAGATGREPEAPQNEAAEGSPTTEVGASAATTPTPTTTTPTCTTPVEPAPAPPTPPEEPPADVDPENPDEDADGIPDDQERVTYEQQMAEYQAAVAAQQAAPPADSGC